ncbi:hypothetical protein HDU87_001269 [Geranomyces variabilis]|uniref:Phosphoadenosine phosphosulphate reductase domain-containing protein n=1 Tax=Geranomyces variabilis TaxID=109894 RepID=A0AAD5TBR6_9FUNG|nr:hypothetical protein HDU87_001269 [Geranomyces variabilis]
MAPSVASDAQASSSSVKHSQPSSSPALSAAAIFTAAYLDHLNSQLATLEPQKIIQWALVSLPGLYQTTAFGLTGLVILDMISKISQERQAAAAAAAAASSAPQSSLSSSSSQSDDSDNASASASSSSSSLSSSSLSSSSLSSSSLSSSSLSSATRPPSSPHLVPLIFIDTLHHFPETLHLATTAAQRYSAPLHTYRPAGPATTAAEFASVHGSPALWSSDPDSYDYLVKVEPAQRAYAELGVRAVFTGRRRTQRGARSAIPILELDASAGVLKVNALAAWDYDAVWAYIREHNVPYNPLIDKGYKSVGDVHSTLPTAPGEGERDGRWKGQEKTECGLHKDYFKMRAQFLAAQKKKARGTVTDGALQQAAEAAPVGA